MILHLNGEPIRVLHVNRESGESTIVFRNHTMRLPTQHLVMISDSSLENLEALQELLQLNGAGVGGDSNRALVPANFYDSDIFAPLTVGDLYKPPKKGRGSGGNPE